jgi:hypothetical protein
MMPALRTRSDGAITVEGVVVDRAEWDRLWRLALEGSVLVPLADPTYGPREAAHLQGYTVHAELDGGGGSIVTDHADRVGIVRTVPGPGPCAAWVMRPGVGWTIRADALQAPWPRS